MTSVCLARQLSRRVAILSSSCQDARPRQVSNTAKVKLMWIRPSANNISGPKFTVTTIPQSDKILRNDACEAGSPRAERIECDNFCHSMSDVVPLSGYSLQLHCVNFHKQSVHRIRSVLRLRLAGHWPRLTGIPNALALRIDRRPRPTAMRRSRRYA